MFYLLFVIIETLNIIKNKRQAVIKINESINSREVRLIDENGKSAGIVKTTDAISRAKQENLDLVEISATARPPVAQIMDYGKYQYTQKKLRKERFGSFKLAEKKSESKITQIKTNTSKDILQMRAKMSRKWMDQGYRVQIDLFLSGRYKNMDKDFLREKLEYFVSLIPEPFRILEDIRQSPKGYSILIQASK